MEKVHHISPRKLDIETVQDILKKDMKLKLSKESENLITRCRKYLDEKVEKQVEPIYGITTGFGSLCNHSISRKDLEELQKNLVISHACGTGEEVSGDVVRLMLLLKIHALSLGNSGVQLKTVQRLIDLYNHGIYPVVYELGSLGASGDLAPLAHLVLPLLGLGEVKVKGEKRSSRTVMKEKGLEFVKLQSKEGLALLNGTQFMSAHGIFVLMLAKKLLWLADLAGALSIEAFNGRMDPFYEPLHQIRPHRGQLQTARNIRKILEGSEILSQKKRHIQDPYSFRCIPQVHGATKDAYDYALSVIITEINSVTDNPTIFPGEDMIVSGGNFHGQPLALTFDFLAMALAELGSISERRIYRLISGERNLPEFLIANPGLNSGFMIPQYTAASIVSQNKQLCTPSSIDSIPSSNEQEDHVSMGANGATKLLKVAKNVEKILSIEFFAAAQAIEFRRPLKTSVHLENILHEYRKQVSFIDNDKIMYKEMDKTLRFIGNLSFE